MLSNGNEALCEFLNIVSDSASGSVPEALVSGRTVASLDLIVSRFVLAPSDTETRLT